MRGQRTRTPRKARSPSPWNGSQNPIGFCRATTQDDVPGMPARGREHTTSFDGAKVSEQAQFRATGRRKTSVARVILRPGEGKVVVNRRPFEHYFHSEALRQEVQQPLVATETAGKFDLLVNAQGGGIHQQIEFPGGLGSDQRLLYLLPQRLRVEVVLERPPVHDHFPFTGP